MLVLTLQVLRWTIIALGVLTFLSLAAHYFFGADRTVFGLDHSQRLGVIVPAFVACYAVFYLLAKRSQRHDRTRQKQL